MRKKLLICLSFVFLLCLFCLPLAFNVEKAYAANNYDISGYVLRNSQDTTGNNLYSNGNDLSAFPRTKLLSVANITGISDTTKVFKNEFGTKAYMLPVASDKENEHVIVTLTMDGGVEKLKIEAVKSGEVVIYVAIADTAAAIPEIYIINLTIVCNLPTGLAINYYSTPRQDEYELKVGNQEVITIQDIINFVTNPQISPVISDLRDGTDIKFSSVTTVDDAGDYVEITTFSKLFTIYGKKELVSATPCYLRIILEDQSTPTTKKAQFDMRLWVNKNDKPSVVEILSANIDISKKNTVLIKAETLASNLAGKALQFNDSSNRHALRDESNDPQDVMDEEFNRYVLVRSDVCSARIITDANTKKLEITPIKNGFTTLVVYVSTVATGDSPSTEIKVFVSVMVRDIYDLEIVSIDSLRKATFSIYDKVFNDLERDGFSLVGIDSATSQSSYLVASVDSGNLVINPKAEGEYTIQLDFSNGISQIRVPLTIQIHNFDLFQDLSTLEIIAIIGGIVLLLLLIILLIVWRVRKRKKKAVETVESKVVIGRRDAYSGSVINPALNKVREQQGMKIPVAAPQTAFVNNPYMMLNPNQPQQQNGVMALNAAQQVRQQPQFQPQYQAQQPVAPVFMALTQGKGEQVQTVAVPEFQQPQQVQQPQQAQQIPQVMNIYVTEAPKEEVQQNQVPPVTNVYNFEGQPVQQQQEQPIVLSPAAPQYVQAAPEFVVMQPAEPKQEKQSAAVVIERELTDDEILEKAFKERYQNTMKYRQFRKDKELQTQILIEEREKIRIKNEVNEVHQQQQATAVRLDNVTVAESKTSSASAAKQAETPVQEPPKAVSELFVTDEWIQEADLSKLIDKQMDLDEELLKSTVALREISEEKEKLNNAAGEAMKKYKDLEKEIEELKIKLSGTPDTEEAAPIYEKLNAAEGEYDAMKESIGQIAEKIKTRRTEIENAEKEYSKRKASLELAKMDVEDRIKELKDKQAAEGVVTISVANSWVEEEPAVPSEEEKQAKSREADDISKLMLEIIADRNRNELKREEARISKEIAEKEVKELELKFAKSVSPVEKEIVRMDMTKKQEAISVYDKEIKERDGQINDQTTKLIGQEIMLNALSEKYGMTGKLQEVTAARAQQEEVYKVEKERLKSEIIGTEEKQQKAEEMDALTEFMLKTITDRNRTELKSENVKFRKELAEHDLRALEERLAKSQSPTEQAEIKKAVAEKHEDITEYNKKLREYDDYMSEYNDKMGEYEGKLVLIASKYGMEQKLQEFNMARVQQDFDHRMEKERIKSEKLLETERIEAEKKLERERLDSDARVAAVGERVKMEEAEKRLENERAENERKFRELEDKAKQGVLSERLGFKRQQLAFVSEDVPKMRDPEHGQEMLQKVEKIEKDLAQDERNSDIIFEIGRVKDSIHHGIELSKLRAQLNKKTEMAPAPQQAAAPVTRTVVKKVTNNVRKVSAQGNRQPQVIRVSGSRPGTAPAQGQRPAMAGQRPAARPGMRTAAPATRQGAARPGQRPAMAGQRPAARPGMRTAAPATRQGAARPGQRPAARPGQRPATGVRRRP